MTKAEGILWEGASPVDGAPLVAIATDRSRNTKTGRMVQVYILRADMSPVDAVATGADVAICGHCPMRSGGSKGRGCYVRVAQGPQTVWRRYARGGYPSLPVAGLAGRKVRLGAYGDPAMLPAALVREIAAVAAGTTGYTHQWATPYGRALAGVVMASVETLAGARKAARAGFGTFRVGLRDGADQGDATLCPSKRGVSCFDCGACDGQPAHIYIPAHGFGALATPAERQRKRLLVVSA